MSLVSRSLALFSGILLLQLTLPGSDTLCASGHAEMPVATADAGSAMGTDDCDGADRERDDGCDLPWMLGPCVSMTSCVVAASATSTLASHVGDEARTRVTTEPAGMRSGPSTAPELPPPRA
jgi:hypothetical protein